jgi:hypothetical protein
MSLGLILAIILIIFLLGGFSGRFGGYGYGYGSRRRRDHRHHSDCRGRSASHGQALATTTACAGGAAGSNWITRSSSTAPALGQARPGSPRLPTRRGQ